jgi:tRNA(Ile)-lysidine synthase
MAGTRKPLPPEPSHSFEEGITGRMPTSEGVCVALSGGVDSVVLLHVLQSWARRRDVPLTAMHVHHGISPNADAWASFCAQRCATYGVPLQIERVDIGPWRNQGIEAAARMARWQALARCGAMHVALAHHRDDQAETILLQLLRGAGLPGLAAMGAHRVPRVDVDVDADEAYAGERRGASDTAGAGNMPIFVRPMLEVTRAQIDDYARRHGLAWVHDESNDNTALTRNYLRHQVMPLLVAREPAAIANLARSARHLAQAADLLLVLGRLDLRRVQQRDSLLLSRLLALPDDRAVNALRTWLRGEQVPPPSTLQMDELMRQLRHARKAANVALESAGYALRRFRDRLYLVRQLDYPSIDATAEWNGRMRWPVPSFGGVLIMRRGIGVGMADRWVQSGRVSARLRTAGARIRLHAASGSRTLKNVFQEAGLPPWERERLPLVHIDGELAFVPGVGGDAAFRAHRNEIGWTVVWRPHVKAIA